MQVENSRIPIAKPKITGKILGIVFYFQLIAILILAVILIIKGFVSSHARHRFHLSDWYPPMLSSIGLAGITGLAWQFVTQYSPSFSPMLTCAMGVLLISIGSGAGLAFGILSMLVSAIHSLYACWARPRFEHAVSVLSVCTAKPPPKTIPLTFLAIIMTVNYSSVMMGEAGGARASGTHIDKLFISIILLSMIWTLQVLKNFPQVTVSRVRYMSFVCRNEKITDICTSLGEVVGPTLGSVCYGSIIVPIISLVRGFSRATSLIVGDSDEFLFSCADCYSGIASRLVRCGNRWGFVYVGVYEKRIDQSSADTWDLFRRSEIEELIDCGLTSSFCFFCGVTGGALSALIRGCWTLLVYKEYATEIAIYGFLIGYFISRVAIAWPQACVSAYHVAFAENPKVVILMQLFPFGCRSSIETGVSRRR